MQKLDPYPSIAVRVVATVILALSGVACAARLQPAAGPNQFPAGGLARTAALQRELDAIFSAPAFDRALWAVAVQSLDTGEILYRLNASKLVMPASNMKILTLAAAAERLGWDFTFETRLLADGPIDAGTLRGNVIVVGSGDPTINSRSGSPTRIFDQWADALLAAGIRRIEGRLVGDDRAFDRTGLGAGWAWDYLGAGYAAPVSALQYNENVVQVTVRAGSAPGTPASVSIAPGGSGLTVDSTVITGAAGTRETVDISRLPGSGRLVLTGTVPLGAADVTMTAAVDDPTSFFLQALNDALSARGIAIRNPPLRWDLVAVPPTSGSGARELVVHRSPPLSEIATVLMKVSQNLYAETLVRALGAQSGRGSARDGQRAIAEVLTAWGVPADGYILADGSGLSRYNYTTADTLVRVLQQLARDPRHAGPFTATLPVGGKDGTIARRLRGTAAENNARAKTGSIANVRALSGYVTARDGERLIFSMIANNFAGPAEPVLAAIDAAVERLASFSRTP